MSLEIILYMKKIVKYKFVNGCNILLYILILIPISIVISLCSYNYVTGESIFHAVDIFDQGTKLQITIRILLGILFAILTSPVSLPMAFGEQIGVVENSLFPPDSTKETIYMIEPWIIITIYWIIIGTNLLLLFKKRYLIGYIFHAIMILTSSIYWISISWRVLLI